MSHTECVHSADREATICGWCVHRIHGSDSNRALDGLELLEAIIHGLEEQFEDIEDDEDFTEAERQQEYDLMYQSDLMNEII